MTGDRDTLTPEEIRKIEFVGLRETDVHTAPTELIEVVESIVAARVRAAQAQAWDEGADHVDLLWFNAEHGGDRDAYPPPNYPNPYRLDAGDEFQNPED